MSRALGICRSLRRAGLYLGLAVCANMLQADDPEKPRAPRRDDRSAHFLIHTDLSQDETTKLLERMEEMLVVTSDYWRRPARGLIECFIVADLQNWSDDALPHPMARLIVDRIGGVTLIDNVGAGIHARSKVVILAASRPGVAEHEVVHAYCGSVFGVTGPAWYREGIAQVFAYAQGEKAGMQCPPELLPDLTTKQTRPIREVIHESAFTQRLSSSLTQKMNRRQHLVGFIPISDWSEHDIKTLNDLKGKYAWSWLTCYLLHHNPTYRSRFRSLGQSYLADHQETFGDLFGADMDRLSFEYDFTVRHFAAGYRVDLCYWDWDKRFRCAHGGRPVRTRVTAARGYQASGLIAKRGETYRFETNGLWSTDTHPAHNAAGNNQGRGRLEGVLLKDYRLSKPIDLGSTGELQVPSDGLLYLRCRDDWSQLGDNTGSIVVTMRRIK